MKKTTKATKLGIILTISVILNILFGWIGGNPFSYARKINQAIELSSEIPAMQQAVGNMHNKMDAIATMIMLLCEKVDVNIPETIRRDILRNNHSVKPKFKIGSIGTPKSGKGDPEPGGWENIAGGECITLESQTQVIAGGYNSLPIGDPKVIAGGHNSVPACRSIPDSEFVLVGHDSSGNEIWEVVRPPPGGWAKITGGTSSTASGTYYEKP